MKSRSMYRTQLRWSWAQSLENVLSRREGREMLKLYFDGLAYQHFNTYSLELWEMIDDFQIEKKKNLPRNEEKTRLTAIYNHAKNYVNFDARQLRHLKPLQTGSDKDLEDDLLEQAKKSAEVLMRADHQGFASWIVQNTP